jgi:putative ABC transport system ATP-binding protein
MSILEMSNVKYAYGKQPVLRGISAQFEQGKMYAIRGPSRCGKTTLLSLLGGLDSPSSGQILYQGEDIAKSGLAGHRCGHVAFIFQSYNLIDYLTPMENVAMTSNQQPLPILERLGLTAMETKRNVLKLSGGQRQVAIAHALASGAQIFLADEPTGNLDEETAAEITAILKRERPQIRKVRCGCYPL